MEDSQTAVGSLCSSKKKAKLSKKEKTSRNIVILLYSIKLCRMITENEGKASKGFRNI